MRPSGLILGLLVAAVAATAALAQQHSAADAAASLTALNSNRWASRALLQMPQPLPEPFALPETVAASTRAASAAGAGARAAYADRMCAVFASPAIQGTRSFTDTPNVKLFQVFQNLARAASVYEDGVAATLADVLLRCNALGGAAAEGAGYGIAFVYAEGTMESLGMSKVLQLAASKQGCAGIGKLMDVAAAVIGQHQAQPDDLHRVMRTYGAQLAACTPADPAFQPTNPIAQAKRQAAAARAAGAVGGTAGGSTAGGSSGPLSGLKGLMKGLNIVLRHGAGAHAGH